MAKERLYDDLAWIWPIMSPPEEYIVEADFFAALINKYSNSQAKTILNLGCGGGHLDRRLKEHYSITGIDKSIAMLELARSLNPEASYIHGDMRSVRLGKLFDVVLIHDSINYILYKEDLRMTFVTAWTHLAPGGLFLTVVEITPEKFTQNKVIHSSHERDGIEVTSIESYYDRNLNDTFYEIVFVYLIRQNKKLRVEIDNHTCGIFPMPVWHQALKQAGFFEHKQEKFCVTEPDDAEYDVLVAIKR